MDAEALLEQEDTIAKLKGKFGKRDIPSDVAKLSKTNGKLLEEEAEIFEQIQEAQELSGNITDQQREQFPSAYAEMRKLKYYGQKEMNEVLLKQVEIFLD